MNYHCPYYETCMGLERYGLVISYHCECYNGRQVGDPRFDHEWMKGLRLNLGPIYYGFKDYSSEIQGS